MPDHNEKMPSRCANDSMVRNIFWRIEAGIVCMRYLVWSSGCVKHADREPAAPPSQKGCFRGFEAGGDVVGLGITEDDIVAVFEEAEQLYTRDE